MSELHPTPPLPEPSLDSQPYWDGLRDGQLLIQRCSACDRFRHYPTPTCPHCHAFEHRWTPISRRASVHSWTVAHHAFHPAYREQLPYVIVTADLEEGVRICAMARGIPQDQLRLDLPLWVEFERLSDGFVIPVLVPR